MRRLRAPHLTSTHTPPPVTLLQHFLPLCPCLRHPHLNLKTVTATNRRSHLPQQVPCCLQVDQHRSTKLVQMPCSTRLQHRNQHWMPTALTHWANHHSEERGAKQWKQMEGILTPPVQFCLLMSQQLSQLYAAVNKDGPRID